MRLTLWQGIGLASLAAILLAFAVFDASGAPPSCEDADAKLYAGLLADAESAYGAVLDENPDAGCAKTGMDIVVEKLCERAWTISHAGHPEDANKVYARALATEPAGYIHRDCWVATTPPEATPTCKESGDKPCVVVVRGQRGPRGDPGEKGDEGDKGDKGDRGPPGRDAYVPCCPG
jgi:hypothetical protein